ncbi:Swt1 family HEPN domain-containing protein [Janthinobacterium sp. Ant5-2-1]|uniref:Swt1 family HEPN domain-containing protein n=1 Tax=Janthinobacterium sp. Ant5-2-1 TaxID=1755239 RepID=UPI000A63B94B|nr:Swt1 family HEPN domain-containing protein [Janthinobacterium sp. Ant5-2-1]
MAKLEDHIRSFGMSGFLLIDEVRSLEQRYGIELGHGVRSVPEEQGEYYPQFEQSVRVEAARMSQYYELFYCLEQAIRKLISETLIDATGAIWWHSGKVPAAIVKDVNDRIQREVDSGLTQRSEFQIDYTTFGELSMIITSNWDLFGTIFTSRRAVEKIMSILNNLRGPIAHCCPMAEDEIVRLQLAVKDWFRIIG